MAKGQEVGMKSSSRLCHRLSEFRPGGYGFRAVDGRLHRQRPCLTAVTLKGHCASIPEPASDLMAISVVDDGVLEGQEGHLWWQRLNPTLLTRNVIKDE